jgi:hypothetical protein
LVLTGISGREKEIVQRLFSLIFLTSHIPGILDGEYMVGCKGKGKMDEG